MIQTSQLKSEFSTFMQKKKRFPDTMIKGLWSEYSLGILCTKAVGNNISQLLVTKIMSSFSKVGFF
jgi:hypothetical protein